MLYYMYRQVYNLQYFIFFFYLGLIVPTFQNLMKHSLRSGGILCTRADTIWGNMSNVDT